MKLEKDLERSVRLWAWQAHRIESLKVNIQGNKGWPDVVFLIPGGRPALIEFKRKGAKPYPLQIYRMRQLQTLGYDYIWTDDYETAVKWLKTLYALRISAASYRSDDKPRRGRAAPRSRARQDQHKPSRQ